MAVCFLQREGEGGKDPQMETTVFYNLSSKVIKYYESIYYMYSVGEYCTRLWIPKGRDHGAILKAGY